MAHNIAKIGGKDAMMCVGDRNSAWHKLGQRIAKAATWQQACKLGGLDWNVVKHQLRGPFGKDNLVDAYGIFRDSDNAFLGAVGGAYTPIQNKQAFEFVDTLLEAENGAHYESAGALGNGERVWCLAKVPYDFQVVAGDKHEIYLLFTTSHDGTASATCKITDVRVVCQNTLNQSMTGAGKFMRVMHTRQAERKLEEAKTLMQGTAVDVKKLEEKLRVLSMRKMTKDSMKSVFEELYPLPKEVQKGDSKGTLAAIAASVTRRENIIDEIVKAYDSNDKNAFPIIRGTAYNLLNACVEYTDHLARPDEDNRKVAESLLFGTAEKKKESALDIILEATKGAPVHQIVYSKTTKKQFTPPVHKPIGGILGDIVNAHAN